MPEELLHINQPGGGASFYCHVGWMMDAAAPASSPKPLTPNPDLEGQKYTPSGVYESVFILVYYGDEYFTACSKYGPRRPGIGQRTAHLRFED